MKEQDEVLSKKETSQTGTIKVQNVNVQTYDVSPEIMENIKKSIMFKIKTDNKFMSTIFETVLKEKFELNSKKQTAEEQIITLKKINEDDAKKQIKNFIENNPGCKTSEIIMELQLDPGQVMEILKQLKEEESIRGESISK